MEWLPGVERIEGNSSGLYDTRYPFRLILHSTEGSTIQGAVGAYENHNSWPHLTVDPVKERIVQHVPFTRAARALKNRSGGVQTNLARAIQVEIVGFAAAMPEKPHDELDWLGVQIVRPICGEFGIKLAAPRFVGPESGTIATSTAPQRMSQEQWRAFNAVAGHQHVPENDHWDPGRINIARILLAASEPPEEDDMPAQLIRIPDGRIFAVDRSGITAKHIERGETLRALQTDGFVVGDNEIRNVTWETAVWLDIPDK